MRWTFLSRSFAISFRYIKGKTCWFYMKKIALFGGLLCLIYVGLGLILGLLPVNFWSEILDILKGRDSVKFYKVVPTEGTNSEIFFVTIIGITLIALSRIKSKKQK